MEKNGTGNFSTMKMQAPIKAINANM